VKHALIPISVNDNFDVDIEMNHFKCKKFDNLFIY